MTSYFGDEKEIILYKYELEFICEAKNYIDSTNINLSLKMKKNIRKELAREHTWMNRFDKIYGKL